MSRNEHASSFQQPVNNVLIVFVWILRFLSTTWSFKSSFFILIIRDNFILNIISIYIEMLNSWTSPFYWFDILLRAQRQERQLISIVNQFPIHGQVIWNLQSLPLQFPAKLRLNWVHWTGPDAKICNKWLHDHPSTCFTDTHTANLIITKRPQNICIYVIIPTNWNGLKSPWNCSLPCHLLWKFHND